MAHKKTSPALRAPPEPASSQRRNRLRPSRPFALQLPYAGPRFSGTRQEVALQGVRRRTLPWRELGWRALARRPLCLERGGIALKRFGHPATERNLLRFRSLLGLPPIVSGARAEINEATVCFGGIGHSATMTRSTACT
jgi:hypothetical protein